ncbi:MAG TPA: glycoside hydrolase family 13 protein [Rhodothermales bacterium]|nr:glycoside hydrolase family 13 protein [Rhodothermales bacterium]
MKTLFFLLLCLPFPLVAQTQVPEWAKKVIWYQIFPERFRDGDSKNQPIRESIEYHDIAPSTWQPARWTGDWYERVGWELESKSFYDPMVFQRRYGGDLQGVLEKLPYLSELGITGIYFNPVFFARSMHKYDASSFHHIEPYFGPDPEGDLALIASETADPATWKWTTADKLFLHLVKEAHERGIRVIIDGVFNHSGRDFFAFKNLIQLQEKSPYKDWYIVKSFDNPRTPENEFKYKGWWDVEALPVFADTPDGKDLHPEVKQHILAITKRWMDPNGDGDPVDGIDGWRLDVADEVPVGFWTDWNAYVRKLNPNAITITEVWHKAHSLVTDGGFTASMNYEGFAIPVHDYLIDGRIKTSEFTERLVKHVTEYVGERPFAMQNLTDSHDTDRLASMIVNADKEPYDRANSPRWMPQYKIRQPQQQERHRQRLIELFRFTMLGAPMIYYGTEAGMWGGDDPDDRKPMLWEDLEYDDEAIDPRGVARTPDPNRFDQVIFGFYQSMIAFRKRFPVFSNGDFSILYVNDQQPAFAFGRKDPMGNQAVVAINPSKAPHTIRVQAKDYRKIQVPAVVAPGETVSASLRDGWLTIHIPPESGAVFVLSKRSP